jgi:hypothetical protein
MYVSLRSHVRPTRTTRTQALLLDSLASAVATWTEYADFDWADEEEHTIDAIEALRGLRHLARERARLLSSRGLCEGNHLAGERDCLAQAAISEARRMRSAALYPGQPWIADRQSTGTADAP